MTSASTHHRSTRAFFAAFVVGAALLAASAMEPASAQSPPPLQSKCCSIAQDGLSTEVIDSDDGASYAGAADEEEDDTGGSTQQESEHARNQLRPSEAGAQLGSVSGQKGAAAGKPRIDQLTRIDSESPSAQTPGLLHGAEMESRYEQASEPRAGIHCGNCVRRVSLIVGGRAGTGLPTKHSSLDSDTQRLVTGMAVSSPAAFLSVSVPLSQHWELVPTFGAQVLWIGEKVELAPSVELRARVFPGQMNRRWEEFFIVGVGYGELYHLVQAEEISGTTPVRLRDLQRAAAGPFRVIGAMGGRWNSYGRVAVDIEIAPYLLLPNWSFHLELSLGIAIKL